MWKKISRDRNLHLSAGAGLCIVLSFIPFHLVPFLLFFPGFLNEVALRVRSVRRSLLYGFITSFVVVAGGFWWVTYVIHVFGHMSWALSVLLYLGFCGFGALNFSVYLALAGMIHKHIDIEHARPVFRALWFVAGLPALFTLPEFLVPKLFPFYVGHSLYFIPWLTQICEITGSVFLTFCICSAGGALHLYWKHRREAWPLDWRVALGVPVLLWSLCLGFSLKRLSEPPPPGRDLTVALIQANIGSLEKVKARAGIFSKVRHIMGAYFRLTDEALQMDPKPQLLVWPETAMPFHLSRPRIYARKVKQAVRDRWKVPLITGAYTPWFEDPTRDYNTAYLLEPMGERLRVDMYHKNILLAFGEYFPGDHWWPSVYRYFPQVSNFVRGNRQNAFTLEDGTRLGVTICYEAIVPRFYRKVVQEGVHAVVNLTNDSWFGPTTEPYHHGALSTFRSIEYRLPLLRVTNTGISFTVDTLGRMSRTTGVYEEGILHETVRIPEEPPRTFYLVYGDWFVWLCGLLVTVLTAIIYREHHVSVSS